MAKVEVVHLTSPLCHWSWGFEPVMNRLRMRYGKQVEFTVGVAIPYTEREQWLKDYGMTAEEAVTWVNEDILSRFTMPTIPVRAWGDLPETTLPPAIAAKAAGIVHGPDEERRLLRALMHAFFVEGLDTSQDKVIAEVVERVGLDNARMGEVARTDAPADALGDDSGRAGHGANFFSLLVREPSSGTVVTLPHAYDPGRVEAAIQYLSGGKAKPKPVKPDVAAYAEEHGPVSLAELRVAFDLPADKAKSLVARAEKAGDLARVSYSTLPRVAFWKAA